MLVYGEKARDGGLDKSLLERLLLDHQGSKNHVTLVTNYRCHKDIFNLSEFLFYRELSLKAPLHAPKAFGLYKSESSIHFICSSIDDNNVMKNVNEVEANDVADVLTDIIQQWPTHGVRDFRGDQICVMSKNRSQVRILLYVGIAKLVPV